MKNIIFFSAVLILFGIFILGYISSRPVTKEAAIKHLRAYFEKVGTPGKNFSGVQALVYSETLGINEIFAFGESSAAADEKIYAEEPFHIASIGKLFTATLIMMLAEQNALKLSDPVSKYLDKQTLEGLFVYEGVDHAGEVTVRQLMDHTSGAADYFDDVVKSGEKAAELIISKPEQMWTPGSLLAFTRDNQSAVGTPGKIYHYSDTNYILLGLLVEKLEKKPFHEVLYSRIFLQLKMNDTWMPLRSKPENMPEKPLADIWFKNTEVSRFKSLSIDWAGGGIASTLSDLLAYQEALRSGKLISEESLNTIFKIENKFQPGIYYGAGGMEIRFEDFFFMLKNLPRVTGHIGVLSTHLFYDTAAKTHIIMNFGSDVKMQDSFMALIEVLTTLQKIRKE